MIEKSITQALEDFARCQLLGGRCRRACIWLFKRKRYRAAVAAISAPTLHRTVLQAGVKLWLADLRRETGQP